MSILPSGRVSQLPSGARPDCRAPLDGWRHNLVPTMFDAWRNGLSAAGGRVAVQKISCRCAPPVCSGRTVASRTRGRPFASPRRQPRARRQQSRRRQRPSSPPSARPIGRRWCSASMMRRREPAGPTPQWHLRASGSPPRRPVGGAARGGAEDHGDRVEPRRLPQKSTQIVDGDEVLQTARRRPGGPRRSGARPGAAGRGPGTAARAADPAVDEAAALEAVGEVRSG